MNEAFNMGWDIGYKLVKQEIDQETANNSLIEAIRVCKEAGLEWILVFEGMAKGINEVEQHERQ